MLTTVDPKTDAPNDLASRPEKLIYIGPLRDFPDCLATAVESSFKDIETICVSSIDKLLGEANFDPDALRLVLIHDRALESCLDKHDALLAKYPNIGMAAVINGVPTNTEALSLLMSNGKARGILPFNLPLDVWLSALQLMLRGGEYVPLEFVDVVRSGAPQTPAPQESATPKPRSPAAKTGLTRREVDVLELVAQGLQNKAIAAQLRLSGAHGETAHSPHHFQAGRSQPYPGGCNLLRPSGTVTCTNPLNANQLSRRHRSIPCSCLSGR